MAIDKHQNQRLVLLLAAGNFSDREIEKLQQYIKSTPLENILADIKAVRRQFAETGEAPQLVSSLPNEQSSVLSNDSAQQIERLLVTEAGFSKLQAAELLAASLKKKRYAVSPFNSKDGFQRWLNQFAAKVNLSLLLHTAATIRNSRVHGLGDDWIDRNPSK